MGGSIDSLGSDLTWTLDEPTPGRPLPPHQWPAEPLPDAVSTWPAGGAMNRPASGQSVPGRSSWRSATPHSGGAGRTPLASACSAPLGGNWSAAEQDSLSRTAPDKLRRQMTRNGYHKLPLGGIEVRTSALTYQPVGTCQVKPRPFFACIDTFVAFRQRQSDCNVQFLLVTNPAGVRDAPGVPRSGGAAAAPGRHDGGVCGVEAASGGQWRGDGGCTMAPSFHRS